MTATDTAASGFWPTAEHWSVKIPLATGHRRLPQLAESGFVALRDADFEVPVAQYEALEYMDWKSGGDTNFAPIQTTAAVTVTVAAATTLPQYYRVQRGNTLTEIAASYGIPVAAIMQLNGLTNADDIFAGQILAIPPRDIVASVLPPTVPGQTAPTVAPTVPAAPAATTTTTVA